MAEKEDPAVDPTANVRELVIAAMARQDDLRAADQKLFKAELKALRELLDNKETALHREFALIEKSVRESQSAFEKVIAKSEAAAIEQTKQQNTTFQAMLSGINVILTDAKERIVAVESKAGNAIDNRTNSRLDIGLIIGIAGVVLAIITVFSKLRI